MNRPSICVIVTMAICLATAHAAYAQTWQTLFNGSKTHGMAVDRTTGDVYAVVEGRGIFKSTDQGKTFVLADSKIIKSHAETGSGLCMDPDGGRLMCFMNYGDAGGTLDAGKTWFWSQGWWDYGTVNWADPQAMTLFARDHGGNLQASFDHAKTWKKVDSSHGTRVGLAGTNLLVAGKDGIYLSLDKAATWQKVSNLLPKSHVMRCFKGVCYWLTDSGVIVSKDLGQTWAQQGANVDGCVGPYFGVDEKSMLVVGLSGFSITHDAGATWRIASKLPDDIKRGWNAPEGGDPRPYWFVQFGWDPKANILYSSSLGVPLQQCILGQGN